MPKISMIWKRPLKCRTTFAFQFCGSDSGNQAWPNTIFEKDIMCGSAIAGRYVLLIKYEHTGAQGFLEAREITVLFA